MNTVPRIPRSANSYGPISRLSVLSFKKFYNKQNFFHFIQLRKKIFHKNETNAFFKPFAEPCFTEKNLNYFTTCDYINCIITSVIGTVMKPSRQYLDIL